MDGGGYLVALVHRKGLLVYGGGEMMALVHRKGLLVYGGGEMIALVHRQGLLVYGAGVCQRVYRTSRSSTTNLRALKGGMAPPAPVSP